MNFYHNLITTKSWQFLQTLKKKYDFILIGGWAVFLYTQALKSKDIDLILDFEQLEKLKKEFSVFKNERLKKYEARKEEVEIDIYVPFYSHPGIPAEEMKKFSLSLEGFKVPQKEALALLKQKALMSRKESVKGRKDLGDLISLFRLADFDWEKYQALVQEYNLKSLTLETAALIKKVRKIEELNLNPHQTSRLKKKILPYLQ